MSYPAFDAFFADPERTTARICVYMALQPPILSLNPAMPRAVKVEVVRQLARVSMGAASQALGWLILRGYLVVHARDARGMPSLTLAYSLPELGQLPSVNKMAG
jgi:hypothetical protein